MRRENASKNIYIAEKREKEKILDRADNKKNNISNNYYTFENSGGIITDNEYEVKAEIDINNYLEKKEAN